MSYKKLGLTVLCISIIAGLVHADNPVSKKVKYNQKKASQKANRNLNKQLPFANAARAGKTLNFSADIPGETWFTVTPIQVKNENNTIELQGAAKKVQVLGSMEEQARPGKNISIPERFVDFKQGKQAGVTNIVQIDVEIVDSKSPRSPLLPLGYVYLDYSKIKSGETVRLNAEGTILLFNAPVNAEAIALDQYESLEPEESFVAVQPFASDAKEMTQEEISAQLPVDDQEQDSVAVQPTKTQKDAAASKIQNAYRKHLMNKTQQTPVVQQPAMTQEQISAPLLPFHDPEQDFVAAGQPLVGQQPTMTQEEISAQLPFNSTMTQEDVASKPQRAYRTKKARENALNAGLSNQLPFAG